MRIAAVAMQRDETELLDFWAAYHGRLFGYENLLILDNGSSNVDTLKILANLEHLGVRVLEKSGRYDFEYKGAIVSEIIETEKDSYDWIFPLDIDELVVLEIDGRLSTARDDIFAELDRAASEGRPVLRVSRSYWNIPRTTGAYPLGFQKTIVRTGSGINLDMGFHLFSWDTRTPTIDAANFAPMGIGYVHLHNRFFPDLLAAARQKLRLRVPDFSKETLSTYRGAGRHICRYFEISEQEYYGSFPEAKFDLSGLQLMAQLPIPYSSRAPVFTDAQKDMLYSELNIDAPQWDGMGDNIKQVLRLMTPSQKLFEYGISDLSLAAVAAGFASVSGVAAPMKDKERRAPEDFSENLEKIGIRLVQGIADGSVSALDYCRLGEGADVVVIGGIHAAAIAAFNYVCDRSSLMILKANISEREQQVIGVLFETRKLGAEFSLLVKIEGRDLYAKEVLGAASLHEGVA
jgi:hypothetical protein